MEGEKKFEWAEIRKIPIITIDNIVIKSLTIKPFIKKVKLFEEDSEGYFTDVPLRTKGGRIRYASIAAFTFDCVFDCVFECDVSDSFNMLNNIVLTETGSQFLVMNMDKNRLTLRNIEGYSIHPFFINTTTKQQIFPLASTFK